MSQLLNHQKIPMPVFFICNIDNAGTFTLKNWKRRGDNIYKAYTCIYIYLTTRVVHLKLVWELTSEAFLNILRRFLNKNGKPQQIYCDNGTNFIGAKRKLLELYQFLSNKKNKLSI